ncbi:hypothetical protein M0802_010350 [Mischocyttarus mexicanus]|nr:hypothetical protein M0802_010350 [Mischocyttarus mexicanus]
MIQVSDKVFQGVLNSKETESPELIQVAVSVGHNTLGLNNDANRAGRFMTLTNIGSRKLLIKGSFTPRTDPENWDQWPY